MNIVNLALHEWQTQPGELIALWTDSARAYALYKPAGLTSVALQNGVYPALSPRHPGAAWFERLAHDLNGHTAAGATETRPAIEQFRDPTGRAAWPDVPQTTGDGTHQISLGPVYDGITEPAHFHFSVRGETVLSLQTRLGYSHKSILAMIRGKSPRLAARFAARISGDATVAHSLAFAHAAEAALTLTPPARATHLRAVMAEIERIANHAGTIGAVAGAAGSAILETRFARHQENFRAAAASAFGHRLMMDAVIPGGIAGDLKTGGAAAILAALATLENELPALHDGLTGDAILRDRLTGIGIIPPHLAATYAAGGPVGRASGRQTDLRQHPGYPPYDTLDLHIPLKVEGDAAARAAICLAELTESLRLIHLLLHRLPDGPIAVAPPSGTGTGLGAAESFRGPVWHWLSIDAGTITDAFIADPSTLHWPLLEFAATTGPLADFPLILASINPSHAGVDL